MLSSTTLGSTSSSIDVELLLDRFLSSSTPTDCLDSLEQLTALCRFRRPKQQQQLFSEGEEEERRQYASIDALLRNPLILNSLCSLVATSTTQPSHSGLEVEGGDVAACELLLVLLSSPPGTFKTSSPTTFVAVSGGAVASATTTTTTGGGGDGSSSKGMTTEELQKQQRHKRRKEYISKTLLHFHDSLSDGIIGENINKMALTPSLLDCLCPSSSNNTNNANALATSSVYARVLCLQILQALLSASPGTLREQLIMAPDGINRLVDLLGRGSMMEENDGGIGEESVPEEVRNESILFLTSLASSSSMLARLISFSEGYDRSLKIALESSSTAESSTSSITGLSSTSTVAIDCLELCLAMAHADSPSRELFMGGGDGRGNLDRLAKLADLRGGERFRDKERNIWWDNELKEKRRKEKGKGGVTLAIGGQSVGVQSKGRSSVVSGSKREKKAKDDTLDDILREASSTTTQSIKLDTVIKSAEQLEQSKTSNSMLIEEGPPTPYLTPNEAKVVDLVFSLILVLLLDGDEYSSSSTTSSPDNATRSKRRGRAKVIMSHDLSRYIVDCALYTLPPKGVDYVSAVPTSALQQKALVTMGVLGSLGDTVIAEEEDDRAKRTEANKVGGANSTSTADLRRKELDEEAKLQTKLLFETMPIYLHGWVTAIDRLMYLCCTGAYAPNFQGESNSDDDLYSDNDRPEVKASLLSSYAIAAFRSCLPPETASRMVLHALAPPPPDEIDEMGAPVEPPVVTRLVTTLADNLRFLQDQQNEDQLHQDGGQLNMIEIHRATIGASGAAGALGVFLTKGEGDATREMLLRLSPPPPRVMGVNTEPDDLSNSELSPHDLIEFIVQHLANYIPAGSSNKKLHASSTYIALSLLRLLIDWVFEMPRAVVKLLSSPASVSMGVLIRMKKGDDCDLAAEAIPALSGLLLGLCLEYMSDSDVSVAKSSLDNMENIAWTKETIINLIQSLGVGRYLSVIDEWKRRPLPLPYCNGEERSKIEQRALTRWYSHNVTIVRRRVVKELAGSPDDDSDVSDVEDAPEGAVVEVSSNSSLRSLRKMLLSQSQENEDLQSKLQESLLTVLTQSTLINELKRAVELGTSAETNDLLTEFSEKLVELERVKSDIMKETENRSRLQEEAMEAKDREIEMVRKELSESQTCVGDLKRDKEILNEEMIGLSSAYHLLEQQYHKHNSAEDGGATDNSSGEVAEDSDRSSAQEILRLLDENARLREEGRAANEWMSMAVSKMEEMSSENELLKRSLEEARYNLSLSNTSTPDALAIQNQLHDLRTETQGRDESEAKLLSKDDEIAAKQALIFKLEAQVDEMKEMNGTPLNVKIQELKQIIEGQDEELSSLRQANSDAQEWMASAVAHIAELTKNDCKEKEKQVKYSSNIHSTNDDASSSDPLVLCDETRELQHGNLGAELIQVKAENATHTKKINELSSLLETAQNHLTEVEANLTETERERDELKIRLESALIDNRSKSDNYDKQIEFLQNDIREKTDQLERMQDQLIDDAEENESKIDNLMEEIEAAKNRADDFSKEATSLSAIVEQLLVEKDQLSKSLCDAKTAINTLNAETKDATLRADEAQRRISELEAAKSTVESQVDHLMTSKGCDIRDIEEEITAITAERDDLQLRLDEITKEYGSISKSLDLTRVDNGNLEARNRALEQDNKSLEHQCKELERKIVETEELLVRTSSEMSTLNCELNELKCCGENASEWQQKALSLEANVASLENQLCQQKNEAAKDIELWEARCSTLEESGVEAVRLWQERVEALESDVRNLENQLLEQENEATKTIEMWETRCSTIEESGEGVIREWEERVRLLDTDVSTLANQLQEKEDEAVSSQEKLLEAEEILKSKIAENEAMSLQNRASERNIASMTLQIEKLHEQLEEILTVKDGQIAEIEAQNHALESSIASTTSQIENLREQLDETRILLKDTQSQVSTKDDALASCEKQQSDLANALLETQNQSELVVRQWQERVELLESNICELESAIERMRISSEDTVKLWQERASSLESQLESQEKDAAAAISEWEARCNALNEEIKSFELQLDSYKKDAAMDLQAEVTRLVEELEVKNSTLEKTHSHLHETTSLLTLREKEWEEKQENFAATIDHLKSSCLEKQNELAQNSVDLENLRLRCSVLSDENLKLQHQSRNEMVENKKFQVVVLELQEELKHAKEELQSIATDQFTHKATEMATQALRQQMEEIRARYSADQEALVNEIEARRVAEENVSRLKLDLALLAQATEYDETVDVHVRKMAKKITSENVKTERKEMEELRLTLERLREELGSCRWKERESEEKAANAYLQMSILEQEVSAAKTDLGLMKQAIDELETSKINMSVAFEYRIKAHENDQILSEQSYEEEIRKVRADLAHSVEKRDHLTHKLEQSEKTNAALVYSTTHNRFDEVHSESEVIKLQLERAQLLAQISEMGTNLERRVKEAVAAQVSSSEAELIVEKQSRRSVETSLSEALSELDEIRLKLNEETRSGESVAIENCVQDLNRSLDEMRAMNDKLTSKNKVLLDKLDTLDKEFKSATHDLSVKLRKAEERLRSKERESRFEAALALEIANLRASTRTDSYGNHQHSQALVLIEQNMLHDDAILSDEERKAIDRNSAYIIEMYDYVCELKSSITEEREMYKELLAEHEELLALLGQTGLDRIQFANSD